MCGRTFLLAVVAGLGLMAGVAAGQVGQTLGLEAITQQLRSDDPAEVAGAVAAIRGLAERQPRVVVANMRAWHRAMSDAGMHEQVERFALEGILESPHHVGTVYELQRARVLALTALGRHREALAAAKGHYNVTLLKRSDDAIELVMLCLANLQATDDLRRFRQQQVAGAQLDGGGTGAEKENVLKAIQVDGSPYEARLAELRGAASYDNLMAQGNLLLLADRPAEARKCFEMAGEIGRSDYHISQGIEGVARAIRAEHAAIGPANAYVLALRAEADSGG